MLISDDSFDEFGDGIVRNEVEEFSDSEQKEFSKSTF